MKIIQFVICLAAMAFSAKAHMTEDQLKMMQMLHNTCVKETGVAENAIAKASKGDFEEGSKLKCYMKCTMVQMGVFSDEDSTLDKEAFIEMMPDHMKDITATALDKCTPLSGNDGCEMAFNLNKCFYDFNPEKYMII